MRNAPTYLLDAATSPCLTCGTLVTFAYDLEHHGDALPLQRCPETYTIGSIQAGELAAVRRNKIAPRYIKHYCRRTGAA